MSARHGIPAEHSASVLDDIVADTRVQLERRRAERPLAELESELEARGGGPRTASLFRDALRRPGLAVIAEIKRRAPSAGVLRDAADVASLAGAYQAAGAGAISVLTEHSRFGGSLEDLRTARAASILPILRKDFIVDRYQLVEAALAGADAVLLIVAALSAGELAALRQQAAQLGLDSLIEVHQRDELAKAIEAGADIIGINNRDLRDLSVDLERTFELLGEVPPGVTVVAESGIENAHQLARLAAAGADAALIGSALMRAPDPGSALAGLLADVARTT
ncbi:MAG: indole-3-glycerol phosphate synthase TrpC [Solirubrobacteraceae bacterium]